MMKKMKVKGRHVIISLVTLVLGYILAFSYDQTQNQRETVPISSSQWERELDLRNELVELEEVNRKLQQELDEKQMQVVKIEEELSNKAIVYSNLAEDIQKYRMFLGKIKVEGPGVQVTLEDASYNPSTDNISDYIVHEQQVFRVISELYISGAQAVAINGQRLKANSYIVCDGPVITVDGKQFNAPFKITAIGDADTLFSALNLNGGVIDVLASENIVVTLEKADRIVMDPILGS
ncbi:MAG TPA: DUF881 domain-containing protein [Bacillus sp. (in: firmicutes)]|uniref:DUF881 domain-containing protein n=1 Tax=Bacillus litorisediminis TaxID=2922713 RepID=UPI001FAB427C|nr:DUF881 domain-containing protein [Bacillus litorisediminis]HWO77865.1 DUF881 domain-containing protein [Bacillus sp. (in: firmicutes)]